MDARYTEEAIRYRTTGITRGSHQHIDLLQALFPDEIAQQTGHEATTHILESQRRAVEQLQAINGILHLHHWGLE